MTNFTKEWIEEQKRIADRLPKHEMGECLFIRDTSELIRCTDFDPETNSGIGGLYLTTQFEEDIRSIKSCIENYPNTLEEIERLQLRIAELEKQPYWRKEDVQMFAVSDGDSWCFVLPDFENLQVSPSRWLDPILSNFTDSVFNQLLEENLVKGKSDE